jgi:hypothetical protein
MTAGAVRAKPARVDCLAAWYKSCFATFSSFATFVMND